MYSTRKTLDQTPIWSTIAICGFLGVVSAQIVEPLTLIHDQGLRYEIYSTVEPGKIQCPFYSPWYFKVRYESSCDYIGRVRLLTDGTDTQLRNEYNNCYGIRDGVPQIVNCGQRQLWQFVFVERDVFSIQTADGTRQHSWTTGDVMVTFVSTATAPADRRTVQWRIAPASGFQCPPFVAQSHITYQYTAGRTAYGLYMPGTKVTMTMTVACYDGQPVPPSTRVCQTDGYWTDETVQLCGHNALLLDVREVTTTRLDNGSIVPYVPDHDELVGYYLEAVQLFNPEADKTTAERDANIFADIEVASYTKTWQIYDWVMPDPSAIPPGIDNPFVVSTAIQRWPDVNWPIWLIQVATNNTQLVNAFGYPFIVTYPAYVDWINVMFVEHDDRDLQNYFTFKFVQLQASLAPSLRYLPRKYGPKSSQAEATPGQLCANDLINGLPMSTGRIYVDASPLNQIDIDQMSTMIGVTLNAWHGMIAEVPWMTNQSKQAAFDKIAQVARKVAFPEWIFSDGELDDYYEHLNLSQNEDLVELMNQLNHFVAWKELSTLGSPTDRYQWFASPAVVNAWYQPSFNSITFPAAILMNPIFNGTFPKHYTYSHIGSIMGHELGVYWGPLGGYMPDTWMDECSRAGFNQTVDCVINEYNQFCFPDLPGQPCINGTQTVTENMADNGGLNAAYRAYRSVLQLMGGEPALPGALANYTNEQLFFIGYGNTWCTNENPESVEYLLHYDVHSPDRYRVIGVVENMPEFGQAFNCSAGSPMQPENHCSVWVAPH